MIVKKEAVHKDESYLSVLSRSLCLSFEEFYKDLNVLYLFFPVSKLFFINSMFQYLLLMV